MNCSLVRRLLSAYFDAELPAERRAVVRRHLQGCEACRTRLDGFKNLAALASQWTEARPPASLWQALAPKLVAACETVASAVAEEIIALAEQNEKRPSARRTFKPAVEGLEDRYALADLLGAAAIAPRPFLSAMALRQVESECYADCYTPAPSDMAFCYAGAGAVPCY